MLSLDKFKTFFNLFFAFEVQVLGNSMDINWGNSNAFESRIEFLFWWFIQQKIIWWWFIEPLIDDNTI